MDIVTHALMGTIVASPWLQSHPEAAAGFMFGAVLPDLDAFSRVFGRQAFLRAHQTYSHAFPTIAAIGGVAWAVREATGTYAPWAPLALALGMAFHTVLDWTNTYGITLFAPFSRRRFCKEWVFFIDATVVTASIGVLAALGLRMSRGEPPGTTLQLAYGLAMLGYWLLKVVLRRRAERRFAPPGTLALLPSALSPLHFYGTARAASETGEEAAAARTFRLNALTGAIDQDQEVPLLDGDYREVLEALPEYQAMRALSPAYHVVQAAPDEDGVRLTCRDLRTRNFSTRFGELDVRLDAAGRGAGGVFHVCPPTLRTPRRPDRAGPPASGSRRWTGRRSPPAPPAPGPSATCRPSRPGSGGCRRWPWGTSSCSATCSGSAAPTSSPGPPPSWSTSPPGSWGATSPGGACWGCRRR